MTEEKQSNSGELAENARAVRRLSLLHLATGSGMVYRSPGNAAPGNESAVPKRNRTATAGEPGWTKIIVTVWLQEMETHDIIPNHCYKLLTNRCFHGASKKNQNRNQMSPEW